jgi:hypothetical protein
MSKITSNALFRRLKFPAMAMLGIALFIFFKMPAFRAFDAVVFDKATNKPIEDAYVVGSWPITKGLIFSISAGHVQFQETKTDANGRFHLPGLGFKLFLNPGIATQTPHLVVMKKGYQVLIVNGGNLVDKEEFFGVTLPDETRPTIRFNLDVLSDPILDLNNLQSALLHMKLDFFDTCRYKVVSNFINYLVTENFQPQSRLEECTNFR